jgi:hypothetical protein
MVRTDSRRHEPGVRFGTRDDNHQVFSSPRLSLTAWSVSACNPEVDDRPVAGQRVFRLTQRRELRTLATTAIARKRIRSANLTLSNYLFRLAVQSITTDIGINADFSCVLIKNR